MKTTVKSLLVLFFLLFVGAEVSSACTGWTWLGKKGALELQGPLPCICDGTCKVVETGGERKIVRPDPEPAVPTVIVATSQVRQPMTTPVAQTQRVQPTVQQTIPQFLSGADALEFLGRETVGVRRVKPCDATMQDFQYFGIGYYGGYGYGQYANLDFFRSMPFPQYQVLPVAALNAKLYQEVGKRLSQTGNNLTRRANPTYVLDVCWILDGEEHEVSSKFISQTWSRTTSATAYGRLEAADGRQVYFLSGDASHKQVEAKESFLKSKTGFYNPAPLAAKLADSLLEIQGSTQDLLDQKAKTSGSERAVRDWQKIAQLQARQETAEGKLYDQMQSAKPVHEEGPQKGRKRRR